MMVERLYSSSLDGEYYCCRLKVIAITRTKKFEPQRRGEGGEEELRSSPSCLVCASASLRFKFLWCYHTLRRTNA
jgi:hypothetical protein